MICTAPLCSSTKLQGRSAPSFVVCSDLITNPKSWHSQMIMVLSKSTCCCAVSIEVVLISCCTSLMPTCFSQPEGIPEKTQGPFRKSFVAWYLHPTRFIARLMPKSLTPARKEGSCQGENGGNGVSRGQKIQSELSLPRFVHCVL